MREIHQLPLILGDFGHRGRLVLLQLTDVSGDNLKKTQKRKEEIKQVWHFPFDFNPFIF